MQLSSICLFSSTVLSLVYVQLFFTHLHWCSKRTPTGGSSAQFCLHPCEPPLMPLVWVSSGDRISTCAPLPVTAAFIKVSSRHRERQGRLRTPLTAFQLCELFYPITLWYKHQERRGLCSVQMHRAVLFKARFCRGGSAATNFSLLWCMRAAVWSGSIKFS